MGGELPSTPPACCFPHTLSHLHVLTFGSHPPGMTRNGTWRNITPCSIPSVVTKAKQKNPDISHDPDRRSVGEKLSRETERRNPELLLPFGFFFTPPDLPFPCCPVSSSLLLLFSMALNNPTHSLNPLLRNLPPQQKSLPNDALSQGWGWAEHSRLSEYFRVPLLKSKVMV